MLTNQFAYTEMKKSKNVERGWHEEDKVRKKKNYIEVCFSEDHSPKITFVNDGKKNKIKHYKVYKSHHLSLYTFKVS